MLGALLFLGDGPLADFALALLLGLVIGTVSTVVTAGPAAIVLDAKWPGAGRRRPRPDRPPGTGRTVAPWCEVSSADAQDRLAGQAVLTPVAVQGRDEGGPAGAVHE